MCREDAFRWRTWWQIAWESSWEYGWPLHPNAFFSAGPDDPLNRKRRIVFFQPRHLFRWFYTRLIVIHISFRFKFSSNFFIRNPLGEQGQLQIIVVIRAFHALAASTHRHMDLVPGFLLSTGNVRQITFPPVLVFRVSIPSHGRIGANFTTTDHAIYRQKMQP